MAICTHCGYQELFGAIYCSECGSLITKSPPDNTYTFEDNLSDDIDDQISEAPQTPSTPNTEAKVSLYLVDENHIIPLDGHNEYILGRCVEGMISHPDIDLTPYQGFELGVSRNHLQISVRDIKVTVTDLGSANGSFINDYKISPHQAFPLHHGDILCLGKLKIQLIIRT